MRPISLISPIVLSLLVADADAPTVYAVALLALLVIDDFLFLHLGAVLGLGVQSWLHAEWRPTHPQS